MALTRYDYFYDNQVQRFLMQMVRAFSGFQYATGSRDGTPRLRTVPCTTAKRNRQVAAIQRNMSENTLLTVPQITIDIQSLEPDRESLQNPYHIDSIHATERAQDPVTGDYIDGAGIRVTVDRMMPRPFMITFQVDIWTSNMDQKFQLLEQILPLVYPSFDIQNSDNALDWSAMETATFESLAYSSISVPVGTESEIDVATIVIKVPVKINPPAFIRNQYLINQVVTKVEEGVKENHDDPLSFGGGSLGVVITTPENHSIRVDNGNIYLLGSSGLEVDDEGNPYVWEDLLNRYNVSIASGDTKIRLRTTYDDDETNDIVGLVYPTDEPNVLQWHPYLDHLPSNTLAPINAIIDPWRHVPSDELPVAADGQRYLITEDIGESTIAWGNLTARAGSIIGFTNGEWVVRFPAINHGTVEYVTNLTTARQLKWDVAQQTWTMAVDGTYRAGYWRVG